MQPLDMNKGGFSEWGCPAACGPVIYVGKNKLVWPMPFNILGFASGTLQVTEKRVACPCARQSLPSARQQWMCVQTLLSSLTSSTQSCEIRLPGACTLCRDLCLQHVETRTKTGKGARWKAPGVSSQAHLSLPTDSVLNNSPPPLLVCTLAPQMQTASGRHGVGELLRSRMKTTRS